MAEVLGRCPICAGELVVVRQQCATCGTALEGRFTLPRLLRLQPNQLRFVELFVRCRGVIRDLESELGVSYPTVRARLDEVISALGFDDLEECQPPAGKPSAERADRGPAPAARRTVLDQLAAGTITVDDAVQELQGDQPAERTG